MEGPHRASASLSDALQDLFRLGHDVVDLMHVMNPGEMTSAKQLVCRAWVQAERELFAFRGGSAEVTQTRLSQVIHYATGYTTAVDKDAEATKRNPSGLFEEKVNDEFVILGPQHAERADKVNEKKQGEKKKKQKEKAGREAAATGVGLRERYSAPTRRCVSRAP